MARKLARKSKRQGSASPKPVNQSSNSAPVSQSEVQEAILGLVALAACWSRTEAGQHFDPHHPEDAQVLREIVDLLAKHRAELPTGIDGVPANYLDSRLEAVALAKEISRLATEYKAKHGAIADIEVLFDGIHQVLSRFDRRLSLEQVRDRLIAWERIKKRDQQIECFVKAAQGPKQLAVELVVALNLYPDTAVRSVFYLQQDVRSRSYPAERRLSIRELIRYFLVCIRFPEDMLPQWSDLLNLGCNGLPPAIDWIERAILDDGKKSPPFSSRVVRQRAYDAYSAMNTGFDRHFRFSTTASPSTTSTQGLP